MPNVQSAMRNLGDWGLRIWDWVSIVEVPAGVLGVKKQQLTLAGWGW